jgi:hypothetical protein
MAVQTIEKTGKGWKLLKAIGFVLAFVGLLWWYNVMVESKAETRVPSPFEVNASLACLFAGAAIWLFARLGAWWNHG